MVAPVFFIENTLFEKDLNKFFGSGKKLNKAVEGTYAKAYETYVGQIFGQISPRASPSDTRPDIPLTTSDLDKFFNVIDTTDESNAVVSFLTTLRQNLQEAESESYNEVRAAFNRASMKEKDSIRKIALMQTIGGIEVKGSFGIDLIGSEYSTLRQERQTPRGLTGRQIKKKLSLGQTMPEGSSLVIPVASGVATKGLDNIKNDITNFFKRSRDSIHPAITGEYRGNDEKLKFFQNSAAARQMRLKGNNLWMQYNIRTGSSLKSYSAYLPESFKVENTKLDILPTSLYISYTSVYERKILDRLKATLLNKAIVASDRIIKDIDIKNILSEPPNIDINIKVPTGGSIPIGNIKYPSKYIPRRKSSAFTSRTAAAIQTLKETKIPSMGDFVTDDTITALTKREMMRRMPVGPVGGTPLSNRVLTYRTGRFVQSLQVFADMRNMQMQYYYNPNYWTHESTSRDPRNLITASLNSVTRSLFNKRFNLTKSDSRGNQ